MSKHCAAGCACTAGGARAIGATLILYTPLTLHKYTAAYCPGEVCSSGGGPSACHGGLMQAWGRFICDLLRVEELEIGVANHQVPVRETNYTHITVQLASRL